MEADCFLGSCPQKNSAGHEVLVAIKQESLTFFFGTKSQFYVWFAYLECRRKKTVILLSVGSRVHQETMIQYLSNDSFRSSTSFMRKDCASVFHLTNLTADGTRQFSGSGQQNVVPGHAVPVAIEPGS